MEREDGANEAAAEAVDSTRRRASLAPTVRQAIMLRTIPGKEQG